jgi:allophanate hydrolase
MAQLDSLSLNIHALHGLYASGALEPEQLIEEVHRRVERHRDDNIWIDLLSRDQMLQQLSAAFARKRSGVAQSLLGIPFAVKDNIDVAGRQTTAGCPAFAYLAGKSATVVDRLLAAGAVLVGKTNLDQFATGLTGARSPYGIARNPFDARYITGGSSSGSGAAVAAGLVSFALGTDTAGSGRVPAMYNNIVGMKPTRGKLSAAGMVPACQSLDCMSIFALTCGDAKMVLDRGAGWDAADPYSRDPADLPASKFPASGAFRFGVPQPEQLKFFGGHDLRSLYADAIERAKCLGGEAVTIDLAPFSRAASLLYDGPWLAERLLVPREILEKNPQALHPVTASVLRKGIGMSAMAAFEGLHRLEEFRQQARETWKHIDVMLLPTAGAIYSIAEVEADPIGANSNLGLYTNFVNLLDLSAIAVPSGFTESHLPFGITFVGRAGDDAGLLALGSRFHADTGLPMGATNIMQPATPPLELPEDRIPIAVVGAHLSGEPLNYQLTDRGAKLVGERKTAAKYRLYALPGTRPPKPGLIREEAAGSAIVLEVWEMPAAAVGSFVAAIPPPLTIGSVELDDGRYVKCFLCESYAVAGATDISSFGGWKAFLRSS